MWLLFHLMGTIHDFHTDYNVGKLGENLIRAYYNAQRTADDKRIYITRETKLEEQIKGADLFVMNNELNYKYVEVKTDTQMKDTENFALEYMIEYRTGFKTIGCQMKTYPDYMFYWQHPTNVIYYWEPDKLNPYIVDWLMSDKYKKVKTENKKFFSRSLLVPIRDMLDTTLVHEIFVSMNPVDKVLEDVAET